MSANKPFYVIPHRGRQTCAEIVSEARRSLRTVRTQRPYTPRDDRRRLLDQYSSRETPENRPPSSFSLDTLHFEIPDSRPGSSKQLSPLEYKPKMPPLPVVEDTSPATPTPPTDPQQPRKGSTGRGRLLKTISVGGPPLTRQLEQSNNNSNHFHHPAFSGSSDTQQGGTADLWASEKRDPSLAPCEETVPLRYGHERSSPGVSLPQWTAPGSTPWTGSSDNTAKGADETAYWDGQVSSLLQELQVLAQAGAVNELCRVCERLHTALAEGDLLGRNFRRRSALLRILYRLIDVGSDKLSLQLASLALALSVSGNNLLNLCKLIFRISKNDGNDVLFRNSSAIASLLTLLRHGDPRSDAQALLYSVGTLKFLSSEMVLLRELQTKGAIPVLLRLTLRLNRAHGQSGECHVTWGSILLQLTATLRNLADLAECRTEFLSRPGLPELCEVLTLHAEDGDVCTNVARIFSKLSSYHHCCVTLSSISSCYPAFSTVLRNHSTREDLVVRILFTLGNLTAKSEEARRRTCRESGGLLDVLLALFQMSHTTDVLAKLTRVLANTAIDPVAGATLVANVQCVQSLLDVLESKPEDCMELIINTTAAFNNLSFYDTEDSVLRARPLPLARLMLKQLLSTNMDVVLEAVRVLGNISRSEEVRDCVLRHKAHRFVVTLLDSKRPDLCYASCGVLTNLSTDQRSRAALREEGTVQKLLDCLQDWGLVDWQLAGVVCQALWNCSQDGAVICFGEQRSRLLLRLLSRYLDKEHMLQWTPGEDAGQEVREFYQTCWETEFLHVAQRLRDSIQSQLGVWEPLVVPP